MARPRAFDEDVALDGAMHIFWRQGYGATNLPDLLNAMGLTRGSFYKAYNTCGHKMNVESKKQSLKRQSYSFSCPLPLIISAVYTQ